MRKNYNTTTSTNLAAVSGVVKAGPGTLFSLSCVNRNAANRYLQLFNNSVAPSNAAVPIVEFLIPAGGEVIIGTDNFTDNGQAFITAGSNGSATGGISFGFSTGSGTYTAATASDHDSFYQYI